MDPAAAAAADDPNAHSFARVRVMGNQRNMNFSRVFVSTLGGICAGILGLTGLYGLMLFVLVSLLLSLAWLHMMHYDTTPYLKEKTAVWTEGWFSGLSTYVLLWTLVFNLVHTF